ncbi:MAG: succinylglutamate desuccinylase/aspartoacylase family protein [Methanobrevibacter sp.]|uniref:succinylglutamate desuccinylase/aspartoacylase domain-containing protein n=1 Tax=Methanobrevibacter sp. TaxID=66852 RepID=UPI0026DFEE67|nr:succinylglutamate desuccinylase/aspartoacylase family protein [Methanobrevibacter sp.]MDO5848065.1 succinylglutamate desuccinylase/aspartoacylase family protein [Methanobrevibacter sp.]
MIFKNADDFGDLTYSYISEDSGGYISKNKNIFNYIELTPLNQFVLEKAVMGTPIFKKGSGGSSILVLSGIHGNELSSQIANLKLLNEYNNKKFNHTLYFIPFASPFSTMRNERQYMYNDLNRSAHIANSLSYRILEAIINLEIDFVGDFHTTAVNSNPGFESIFSSKYPTSESFIISRFVSQDVGCKSIVFPQAGASYKGAMEDECNLLGIPAITGEVVSPFGAVGKGSVERSYGQMKSFLSYFGL